MHSLWNGRSRGVLGNRTGGLGCIVFLITLAGCSAKESQFYDIEFTEEREPCADLNPLRNAYFGDTHVHTMYSFDAFTQDVRTTPDDAYVFAQGGTVLLPPLDENGVGTVFEKQYVEY